MWYLLLKRFFQITLFLIWSLTLIYLLFLSIFTFILFTICLIIFLFWFVLTLIGWSIAFIPILIFIFIPWYHQQCRSWTINKQQSHLSVAFFHPYCYNGNDHERVLWCTVESILKKYKHDIQIIIYTGDVNVTPEEILHYVKQHFDIDIEGYKSSITFIYLRSRFLLEAKYYRIFTLLGQCVGSIIVGFEALIRFIPDIYIDSSGYTFTYPCFYYLTSIPIISYVDYPLINSALSVHTNEEYITDNSLLSQIEFLYNEIFAYIYGWCGRCSKIVFCNSSWTKKHIESTWKSSSIHLLYPPCEVKQFLEISLINKDETIISLGQFRVETNHELQIRAFHELLQKKSEDHQKLKLVLIGSVRDNEENKHVEQLQALVNDLNIQNKVEFKLNVSFNDLKTQLNQAMIGLHTTRNESFSIDIVEMMAAGVIVLANKSNGSQMNIIDNGQTGYLASDIDSYATMMQQICAMNSDERHQIQERARDSVIRFDKINFERLFTELFDQILYVK